MCSLSYTGSSSGIGAAAALEFAKLGAEITITGRNEKGLSETQKACTDFGVGKDKVRILNFIKASTKVDGWYLII